MITKWIQFTVAPQMAEKFKGELAVLERQSQGECGCVRYLAFQNQDDESVFTVLESWESEGDFEAHRVADHTAVFKERCGEMILEKSSLSLGDVSGD